MFLIRITGILLIVLAAYTVRKESVIKQQERRNRKEGNAYARRTVATAQFSRAPGIFLKINNVVLLVAMLVLCILILSDLQELENAKREIQNSIFGSFAGSYHIDEIGNEIYREVMIKLGIMLFLIVMQIIDEVRFSAIVVQVSKQSLYVLDDGIVVRCPLTKKLKEDSVLTKIPYSELISVFAATGENQVFFKNNELTINAKGKHYKLIMVRNAYQLKEAIDNQKEKVQAK